MNCVASTYNASGKLVGCTEQDLSTLVSMQLYTVFAMGTGLYVYKSLTAENWVDVAIKIGWGCVSSYAHTKRFATRRVIPVLCSTVSFLTTWVASAIAHVPDTDSEVSVEDDHCYVRVVKDGTELHGYSSIFGLIHHLAEHSVVAEEQEAERVPRNSIDDSDDVVDVNLEGPDKDAEPAAEPAAAADEEDEEDEEEEEEEDADSSDDEEDIKDKLARIENHGMVFDFVMCQVPTLQTATSDTPQCMYVMKYDGFPRTADGLYFCDRKFVPVDHRMIEIVLQYSGAEYELDLSSPDNFYVVGNHLLDPAFMKWFMRKNHGIQINATGNNNEYDYTIKCIDYNATMHTLLPCNYLHVTETGFEVHDSGLI
jgi:hypothetical protein